ncbi:MAG: DNA-(apurinic or apyrimidinic site) lyase, partial [Candidatus Eisenbacteria bacterium]|nr:DNA-(apurinic or apyrimidinic site) lyase [Candidatus Eisenbacteria bacterium]
MWRIPRMPELPDVAGFKRYIDSNALHKTIRGIDVSDRRILHEVSQQTLSRRLKGSALIGTDRHGKYLFGATDKGGWLILHFGMTGDL